MTDSRSEGALLKHYRLQDPFPEVWSDPIEDAQVAQRKLLRQSTARYSVLQEDGASSALRGLVGGELSETLEDEPDSLGTTDSVVRVLKKRGLRVEDNVRLRNRYLVSSKTFSPTAFLRDVHASTPSPVLQQGLVFLDRSIAQKSGSLKELVETNFDRFVAAKGTIEGVYNEMKANSFLDKDKESEYGVGKIRANLNEATAKADDIFGPVMKGRGREESLRTVLGIVRKHKDVLELPRLMLESIKRKDHEALVDEYQKAQKCLANARAAVPKIPKVGEPNISVNEDNIYQLIVAERTWAEVSQVIDEFSKDTWKRLTECKTEDNTHMELIGLLLEIGTEENPISAWLFSRQDYLKDRVLTVFERSRIELETLRRKAAESPSPSAQSLAHYLCAPAHRTMAETQGPPDTPAVVSFWDELRSTIIMIIDPSNGILGELLNYWKIADSFINGDNLLPAGIDDQSRKHHTLPDEDVRDLRSGLVELVNIIRDCMIALFQDPPIDNLSLSASSSLDDEEPLAPPMPRAERQRTRDAEDMSAFWPPGANSLGGVHYLGAAMVMLGNAAVSMADIDKGIGRQTAESLRSMVSTARDRTVAAVIAAWITDAQGCKVMEDWTRAKENQGVTKMPGSFAAFERELISSMQGMVYLDKVRNSDTGVISPPSAKMLSNVRSQFVRSLYIALQGMVENARTPVKTDDWDYGDEGLLDPKTNATSQSLLAQIPSSQHKDTRMLLTLSNLNLLRSELVPELISNFETSFSVKLTDESKTIRDALAQIDLKLFEDYARPITESLTKIVHTGIASPTWPPAAGQLATEVREYVYEALLELVRVHAQVTTTAPALVHRVISHLLIELSRELLEGFKKRKRFTLSELLQATLDVEFINQTLREFTTPKASEWQQMVYVELDRGSDSEARQGLQKELGEMKRILSQLRTNSRNEFLCFKKVSSRRNPHPKDR